jgi:hypothetical protein
MAPIYNRSKINKTKTYTYVYKLIQTKNYFILNKFKFLKSSQLSYKNLNSKTVKTCFKAEKSLNFLRKVGSTELNFNIKPPQTVISPSYYSYSPQIIQQFFINFYFHQNFHQHFNLQLFLVYNPVLIKLFAKKQSNIMFFCKAMLTKLTNNKLNTTLSTTTSFFTTTSLQNELNQLDNH